MSASSLRCTAGVRPVSAQALSARTARTPVPADGSSTVSDGMMAAASAVQSASGHGVENCWRATCSSERRVWEGSRSAIASIIASRRAAPCVPVLSRIARA